MLRVLKVLGITVGALLLIGAAGAAGVYAYAGSKMSERVPVPTHGFTAPTDPASVARGEHVVRALVKCADCHGQDLGGMVVVDDPALGTVVAPNLTAGKGGVGAGYSDQDFELAIRHGIARDGRQLVFMPSSEYQHMSDEDLGAAVAYLRSVPPVDREVAPSRIRMLGRALYVAGQLPLFEYPRVTHREDPVPSVPMDSTVAYGKYIGDVGCAGCHGAGYGGGPIPGVPPDWPKASNLTPDAIGHYTREQFAHVLRTGERPDGTKLHELMPIQATKLMTDVEVAAVHKYLASLPAKPFGTR